MVETQLYRLSPMARREQPEGGWAFTSPISFCILLHNNVADAHGRTPPPAANGLPPVDDDIAHWPQFYWAFINWADARAMPV